jgi:hypothetical protein
VMPRISRAGARTASTGLVIAVATPLFGTVMSGPADDRPARSDGGLVRDYLE